LSVLLLGVSLASWAAADSSPTGHVYLHTFFREPNGNAGLHLAWSPDGMHWEELGPAEHSWIRPTLGKKCMRDPCLRQGPDGTFHLVWTTGWDDKGFGHAASKDLVHWGPQQWVPVNEDVPGAKNTWAPELFYDAAKREWLIFWATTIEGRFPETANAGHHNHRQYYVKTKDFVSFSKPQLLFDPGHNVIDATMIEAGGRYCLIYKDERIGKKELHVVSSASSTGPWGTPSPTLPKPGRMVEGPTALRVGDEWFVYFDIYSDHRYGAVKSRDLVHWEDVTRRTSFPRGLRHGTALEVSSALFRSLLAVLYPPQQARISVAVDRPGVKISPTLYGIFFEEINLAGDGGLYAELVRNRSLEDADKPEHWSLVTTGQAQGELAVDTTRPVSPKNQRSLRLTIRGGPGTAGAANAGYFGIALRKGAVYDLSLAARCGDGFDGPLEVRLESADGRRTYARQTIDRLTADWKTSRLALTSSATDAQARLVIAAGRPGTVWLDMVSLFPRDTWHNRPNGLRPDLAQMLVGLRPSFVRFPGGCWVEGDRLAFASRWKRTIGPLGDRWTQANLWGYQSTNGLGYHEYLQLCEDLQAEPLFVINVGMSHKENVPLDQMREWVQDALDAIEYANGPADSQWGAVRAKAGHPRPFGMKYIEIGNENGGPAYQERYALFYDAIRARYPQMQLIADCRTTARPADIIDEHYYSTPEFFVANAGRYDRYERQGPKIYVGEYAVTRMGGAGNLRAAVGEAAFMTGMERNSDVVVMSSYAPLFANVNYKRWNPDLINFDGTRGYGTPSYYVQQMFSANRGDVVLPATVALAQPGPRPVYFGAVGVGTWATQAEFKDLEVTRGGKTLLAADFSQGTKGWRLGQGQWTVANGVLRQTAGGSDRRAVVGDPAWTDYTYRLKARKLGGAEGFLILFQVRDDQNWLWWNLGGWGNRRHGIEHCVGGSKRPLGDSVPGRIETGRWYDIRVELAGPRVRCYLDGQLVHDVAHLEPTPLHAVASRVAATGQVILKVVNAGYGPCETDLSLTGLAPVPTKATATVLTAASPETENSLDQPTKVSPRTETIAIGAQFRRTFPGNSVTVLQIGGQANGQSAAKAARWMAVSCSMPHRATRSMASSSSAVNVACSPVP
jgi:alpha-L-arabinofuranosidase